MRRIALGSGAAARLLAAEQWLAERADARVYVLGASLDAAAEIARRALAKGALRASLGWQRTTLAGLAASLARPELARRGLAPASGLALEAICARVVHDHADALGRFASIAERPGLPRALARTLGELRLAGAVRPDNDLARLLAAYEAELDAAHLADRAGVLELARAALAAEPSPDGVLLLDVSLQTRAEHDFLAALAKKTKDVLAILPSGDARSAELTREALAAKDVEILAGDGPLAALQQALFDDAAPRATGEDALTVLSAPGESREAVEIARLVLAEAARGTPFDRMAVLLRAPQYGTHVAEAFRRAEVPAFFARGTRRPDPAGRAFMALVACAAEQLSARRFAEYLSLGEVPDDGGEDGAPPAALPRAERIVPPDEETLHALLGAAASAERTEDDEPVSARPAEEDLTAKGAAFTARRAPRHWERLLVEAAVIGTAERWRRRLDGHARSLADAVRAYQAKDEAALAEGSQRELDALESLRRFALPLIEDLEAWPRSSTWQDWLDRLSALATRALRRHERVLEVLAELEPMGQVGNVSLDEVRLVLEPRLSQLRVAPSGRRYGQVFVASIEEARGFAFDVVFVPGLAEKIFPQKVVEDPLLLDDARQKVSADLPTNKDRTDAERLALRLAVGAAARRIVLSYPRVDVEQARPRTPSFYGLEVLRVADGQLGDFEQLAKRAAKTADARIGWPAPALRDDAIDAAEYDLALLKLVLDEAAADGAAATGGEGRYLFDAPDANPHLARALRFRWMRWDAKDFRPADGLVLGPGSEALAAIRAHGTDQRSFSPTALQNYSACPYRFYLSAIHKLAPREEPEPIEDLDPLQRGSLTHEVIYRLLTRLREQKLLPVGETTLESARAELDELLPVVAKEYADRYAPAIQRVWDDAISGIGADLREWLRRMVVEEEWVPAYFELSFGLKDPRAQDAKSTDEPVQLDIGLKVRGSIDLVERRASGALRATDFKTGKVRAQKDSVIGGGEILQPVLYALTLEKLFPGTRVEEGVLYYCTSAGGFEKVPVKLDEEARAAAKAVASAIGDAIGRGFLPAAPAIEKKNHTACTWCDFRAVCGPYEAIRTQKKPQKYFKALAALRKHR